MRKVNRAVHVAIFNSDKTKILLTLRSDLPLWVMPGGHVEKGETIEDAAIREVFEETGINVYLKDKIAVYTSKKKKKEKILYTGIYLSGDFKTSPETKDIKWFDVNKLPFNIMNYEKKRISLALNYNGEVVYDIYKLRFYNELTHFYSNPFFTVKLLVTYIYSKMLRN